MTNIRWYVVSTDFTAPFSVSWARFSTWLTMRIRLLRILRSPRGQSPSDVTDIPNNADGPQSSSDEEPDNGKRQTNIQLLVSNNQEGLPQQYCGDTVYCCVQTVAF